MKNKIISLILSLFLFLFTSQLIASDQAWNIAQEGNKIILIRHSLAPGGGDPAGFKIDDCKTQRNLNKKGINQSKRKTIEKGSSKGRWRTKKYNKTPKNKRCER